MTQRTGDDVFLGAAGEPELLVVLLDCNLAAWARTGPAAFPGAVKACFALVRLLAVARPLLQVAWLGFRERAHTRWLKPVQPLATDDFAYLHSLQQVTDEETSLQGLYALPQLGKALREFACMKLSEAVSVEGAAAEDAAPGEPLLQTKQSSAANTEQPAQVVAVEADQLDSQQVAASSADVLVYPSNVSVALLETICSLHARGWFPERKPSFGYAVGDPLRSESSQDPEQLSPRARLVVISAPGPFDVAESVPLWNAAFCAQQHQLLVDVVRIEATSEPGTKPEARAALQQLAYATQGIYLECRCTCAKLFTHLATYIVPNRLERRYLTRRIPELGSSASGTERCGVVESVDLRATCFQSGKLVHMGYVCSRCLSVYSTPQAACIVCDARLDAAEHPEK